MDVFTRRIIGFGIAPASIDGMPVCRMFNCAIAGQTKPKYLITDHDPLFRFHRWLANLRGLEVEEIKSVLWTPISHPFVERLIGTIRREFFDRVFFWNAADLARKLTGSSARRPNSSERAAGQKDTLCYAEFRTMPRQWWRGAIGADLRVTGSA